jgi:exonuclease SbcC
MVQQKLSGIEREAGQAALKAEELARRFGLTGEVPCAGTDLQGQCQLLGDARDAKALIPSAQGTIQRLGSEKAAAQQELDALCGQHEELAGAPQALARAEHRAERARARASRFALLAAQAGEMARARPHWRDRAGVDGTAGRQGPDAAAGQQPVETPEEAAERQQIHAARQAIAAQHEQQAKHYRATLDRLKQALAALPAPYDEQRADRCPDRDGTGGAVGRCRRAGPPGAVRDAETLGAVVQQATALAGRQAKWPTASPRSKPSWATGTCSPSA